MDVDKVLHIALADHMKVQVLPDLGFDTVSAHKIVTANALVSQVDYQTIFISFKSFVRIFEDNLLTLCIELLPT